MSRRSVHSFASMPIVFILVSMLFLSHEAYAIESHEIDALLQQADDSRTKDFALFKRNLEQLSQNQSGMTALQRDTYVFLNGYKYAYEGDNLAAAAVYQQIIAESHFKELRFRATISAANILAIGGDYAAALDYLDQGLTEVNSIEKKNLKHDAWVIAAIIYHQVKDYDLSINFAELVMRDNASAKDHCAAWNIKLRIQLKKQEISPDATVIQDSVEYCDAAEISLYNLFMYYGQAEALLLSGNPERALSISREQFPAVKASGHKNLVSLYQHAMAQSHWMLGNKSQAVDYAVQALSFEKEGNFNDQIPKSHHLLYQYYKDLPDLELALFHHEKFMISDKANMDDTIAKSMAVQQFKHRNIENAQRIQLLSQENDLLNLQQNLTQKSAENTRLLLILISILSALLIVWVFNVKKRDAYLEKQAALDHLTNIYNRKGMDEYIQNLLKKSKPKNIVIAFAIFDLDLFKQINDKYGHAVGDWVIKKVIRVCTKIGKKDCSFGRLGGEEFGIAMDNASVMELQSFCEQCRAAIEAIDTTETKYKFPITASFGVTSTAISGYRYSDLLSDADAAMYQAKDKGRNQVALYSSKLSLLSQTGHN